MEQFVTDTQAIIIFLNGRKVINNEIDRIFNDADAGKKIIIIPAIVIAEIGYLHEKGRISISIDMVKEITNTSSNYIEEPLNIDIIKTSFEIKDIPELHDRLIAGTARYLNFPLLTNDPVILKSNFVNCIQ